MSTTEVQPTQISKVPAVSSLAVAVGALVWKLARWCLLIYLMAMVWVHVHWSASVLCAYLVVYLELALWAQRKLATGTIQIVSGFLGLIDARDRAFCAELDRLKGTEDALIRAAFGASGKPH